MVDVGSVVHWLGFRFHGFGWLVELFGCCEGLLY
jgi:hypothetical protein